MNKNHFGLILILTFLAIPKLHAASSYDSSPSYNASTGSFDNSLSDYSGYDNDGCTSNGAHGGSCDGGGGTWSSAPAPVACPTDYTDTTVCRIDIPQLPFDISCASHRETLRDIPLRSPACSFSDGGNQIQGVATCSVNVSKSCDPCLAKDCPAHVTAVTPEPTKYSSGGR